MTASRLAIPVQGAGEHGSEGTLTCVSERAEAATREWDPRIGA
jgi:hypothetical protein